MSGFTEPALIKKLSELNNSQQSIQTLSLWLIHHRKHYAQIVKVWYKELAKAKNNRKLTFMYLANDVIQNSKKKGPEFGREFGNVLKKAFEHMSGTCADEKTKGSLGRLLHIWGERGVYDQTQITEFKKAYEIVSEEPPTKKIKKEPHDGFKHEIKHEKREKQDKPIKKEKKPPKKVDTEVKVEVDGMVETHIQLSPHTPVNDPPETEELIKALLELENSASTDADVREKIAKLPEEVSDVSLLSKIQDKEAGQKLSAQVNDAVELLSTYNSRLSGEMDHRKKVAVMLRDYIEAQKQLLAHAEQRLEEYSDKLHKILIVRQEVKSHLQNLPDLTQLPDVTGGLQPLPSAGDLFSPH